MAEHQLSNWTLYIWGQEQEAEIGSSFRKKKIYRVLFMKTKLGKQVAISGDVNCDCSMVFSSAEE